MTDPYSCEVQVLDCAATKSAYGPWVKLRFQSPEQVQHFRKGQRLQIVAVLLDDAEEPEPTRKPIEQRAPYKLSQVAGMMAHEPMYRRWIADVWGVQCENPEQAAQWTREACGVLSRAQLDSDRGAAETFRRLLAEFDDWKGIGPG